MEINYAKRLKLLHALCLAETSAKDKLRVNTNLDEYGALSAADFLSCYITFKAIRIAERNPSAERAENFDMLSAYQAFAILVYAFLSRPLVLEDIQPDFQAAQATIAKTLFAGLTNDELIEILQSGFHKFQLIAEAEMDHWVEYRERLDKLVVSYVIAGTDDDSPHDKAEILPYIGQMLSQLCEAFTS